MSRAMSTLLPLSAALAALVGIALTHGPVSLVLNVVCVLVALATVLRYVVGLNGHDPWRDLRRERRRRGRR